MATSTGAPVSMQRMHIKDSRMVRPAQPKAPCQSLSQLVHTQAMAAVWARHGIRRNLFGTRCLFGHPSISSAWKLHGANMATSTGAPVSMQRMHIKDSRMVQGAHCRAASVCAPCLCKPAPAQAAPPRGHVWDVRAQQQLMSTFRRPRMARASVLPRTVHSTLRPSLCSSAPADSLGARLCEQDACISNQSVVSVWTLHFEGVVLHPKQHRAVQCTMHGFVWAHPGPLTFQENRKLECGPCSVLDCPLGRLLACCCCPLHAHALAPGYTESMVTWPLHVAPGRW